MKTYRWLALGQMVAVIWVLALASESRAQEPKLRRPYAPGYQPAVSPYLNLVRGGRNSAAFNYFTLVRPELQIRAAIQQQAGEIRQLGQEQQQSQQPQVAGTGHPSQFLNYSHYYSLSGQRSGGGSGATVVTGAARSAPARSGSATVVAPTRRR